jgi:hypothetical protein
VLIGGSVSNYSKENRTRNITIRYVRFFISKEGSNNDQGYFLAMSMLSKGAALGVFIGMLGVILNLFPFAHKLEENIGLEILFNVRGPRPAPSEVMVVSIDGKSAKELGLPLDPGKWSHSLHARVIDKPR